MSLRLAAPVPALIFALLAAGAQGCAPQEPPAGEGGNQDARTARELPEDPTDEAPGEPIAASPSAEPASHVADVLEWQAARTESLRSPDGWLALVGLAWLDEGENSAGSAPEKDVVFPEGAPAEIGTFTLEDGTVTLDPVPALTDRTGALHLAIDRGGDAQAPVTGAVRMVPDTEEGTTRLALGTLRFWVIQRGEMIGVRVRDRESPALEAFEGLEYFPVAPAWRVEARLERREDFTVAMPDVLGRVEEIPSPGVLVFEVPEGELDKGTELTLVPTREGDELFIVFGDTTNGQQTYGGGRFLYADAPAADETRVVVDFNRSYNPPCAFTEFATCPLPPRQNKLPLPIPAGEKAYAAGPAH